MKFCALANFVLLWVVVTLPLVAQEELSLNSIYKPNCVLQRDVTLNISGKCQPGDKLKCTFRGQIFYGIADGDGNFTLEVSSGAAEAKPQIMSIKCEHQEILLYDLLVGEVILMGGENNMMRNFSPAEIAELEKSNAFTDQIRFCRMPVDFDFVPRRQSDARWQKFQAAAATGIGDLAALTAMELQRKLQVPIGVVIAGAANSTSRNWISSELAMQDKYYQNIFQEVRRYTEAGYDKFIAARQRAQDSLKAKDSSVNIKQFYQNDLILRDWRDIMIPAPLESVYGERDGSFWFRNEFKLSENMKGDYKLVVHAKADNLRAFVNENEIVLKKASDGTLIGVVKADFLQYKEPNQVAIRIFNACNEGGICGEIYLTAPKEQGKISLAGNWKTKAELSCVPAKPAPYDLPYLMTEIYPSIYYNSLISPLAGYNFKAVCWWQDGTNQRYSHYFPKEFQDMSRSLRQALNNDNLPFFYVQLPQRNSSGGQNAIRMWQAELQRSKFNVMIPTLDLDFRTAENYVASRREVANRFSRLMLNYLYRISGEKSAFPQIKNLTLRDGGLAVTFYNAEKLKIKYGDRIYGFSVVDKKGRRFPAQALIDGNGLFISSSAQEASALEYAQTDQPEVNLVNEHDLPLIPFATRQKDGRWYEVATLRDLTTKE
ncbi:MAG: sialate O-acetylesterase [Victivallaceae bacterium]